MPAKLGLDWGFAKAAIAERKGGIFKGWHHLATAKSAK